MAAAAAAAAVFSSPSPGSFSIIYRGIVTRDDSGNELEHSWRVNTVSGRARGDEDWPREGRYRFARSEVCITGGS